MTSFARYPASKAASSSSAAAPPHRHVLRRAVPCARREGRLHRPQRRRAKELLDKVAAAAPGLPPPLFMPCDVTDVDALRAAIAQTREAFGPIGALVNNAANDQRHTVEEVTPEFWTSAWR